MEKNYYKKYKKNKNVDEFYKIEKKNVVLCMMDYYKT